MTEAYTPLDHAVKRFSLTYDPWAGGGQGEFVK